ncbi:Transcriptional regulator AcuR [compost metagenome]
MDDLNQISSSSVATQPMDVAKPKRKIARGESRAAVVWHGTALLTERGYLSTGVDEVLKLAGVPKGSFYHFFGGKRQFGEAVIDNYLEYFSKRLDRVFGNTRREPLDRLRDFVEEGKRGMAKYDFRRGCLIGNLGQELGGIDDDFRSRLEGAFRSWERRFADCLAEAIARNQLAADADCQALARFFWIGWEGAILRAKLMRSVEPLDHFASMYFDAVLPRATHTT